MTTTNTPESGPESRAAATPARCFGDGDDLYSAYHDHEWGVPVHGDAALFERIALEGFQSGLSWLTVLRKREAFREVFAGFDPARVAAFTEDDVERLLGDARIIRNRAKIEATISNARALVALQESGSSLDEVFWSSVPAERATAGLAARAAAFADVPAQTPESLALSKTLKLLGFRWVGPTTMYAAMQACGVVDDHLASCPVALATARPSAATLEPSIR